MTVQLVSKISNLCYPDPPTLQTDGRTDRQTDGQHAISIPRYALVHRAVRYSKNLGSPRIRPRSIFSQIFNGLLFAWTLCIYLPNLTFVALPIPEIIGCTSKIWGVPGFAHAPYFPKFLKGLCSHGPCEYTCQV